MCKKPLALQLLTKCLVKTKFFSHEFLAAYWAVQFIEVENHGGMDGESKGKTLCLDLYGLV